MCDLKTPYAAVITNKATGEKLTVEVTTDNPMHFNATINGCSTGNTFQHSEWTITPIIAVPTGLGAVVEGNKGARWVLMTKKSEYPWASDTYGAANHAGIAAILRDGGRILSHGVQEGG